MQRLDQIRLKAKLFNGFSDPSRLRILHTLLDNPLSVGEIVSITNLSQPNVSSHLKCLNDCNLIKKKKEGRKTYYSLINPRVGQLIRTADELLQEIYSEINSCINYEVK